MRLQPIVACQALALPPTLAVRYDAVSDAIQGYIQMDMDTLSARFASPASPMLDIAPAVTARRGNVRDLPAMKISHVKALERMPNAYILVHVGSDVKQAGSIAEANWGLYGKLGEPTVTVNAFVTSYPNTPQRRGVDRARDSIQWDVVRGYISIVDGNGAVICSADTLRRAG